MKDVALLDVIYGEIGHWVPRRAPCLRQRSEGRGLILSYSDGGPLTRRHSLNRMSAEVYELCDGERRIEDIRVRMLETYGHLSPALMAEHVLKALRTMQTKGILICP